MVSGKGAEGRQAPSPSSNSASAPRQTSSSAMSAPSRPRNRFTMRRTPSMGTGVGPAVTRMRRPASGEVAQRPTHRDAQGFGAGQIVFAVGVVRCHEPNTQPGQLARVVHQHAVVQGAVHGGRDHDACAALLHAAQRRRQGRGDHGVGDATGHFGDGVVGGRCHQVGVEGRAIGEVFRRPGQAR